MFVKSDDSDRIIPVDGGGIECRKGKWVDISDQPDADRVFAGLDGQDGWETRKTAPPKPARKPARKAPKADGVADDTAAIQGDPPDDSPPVVLT